LNLRPPGPQPGALPDCATPRGRAILGAGALAGRRRESLVVSVGGSTESYRGLQARTPAPVRVRCEHMFVSSDSGCELRRCGRCKLLKPVDQFAWRRKARAQLDNYCRPCRADYKGEHYAANRTRYIANALRRKKAIATERTKYLIAYFVEHPCADCGESDPLVLEFDHLGDKSFTIGVGLRDRSWQALLDEIAKCDVLCANCHRRRTARRQGSVRSLLADRRGKPPSTEDGRSDAEKST
jgi:hypothetical protein